LESNIAEPKGMEMPIHLSPLALCLSIILVTTIAAAALAGFLLVRMARKRGVRLRDLVGPGGG
jgi:hypothetical protein